MTTLSPADVEQQFFTALVAADTDSLDLVLADDFVLIDVMTGSEVPKSAFLDVVRGKALTFHRLDRIDFRMRIYGATAVITGRTEMNGMFGSESFSASSRYTHVFVAADDSWRMVAAQGTRIAPPPDPS
jgi:ketosteroid isomerase-like protein